MEETTTAGKAACEIISRTAAVLLIYIFVFILAALAGYFIGGLFFGEYLFIPVIPEGFVQAAEYASYIYSILRSTVTQCFLLFVGGILVHPMVLPCAVSLYRGFCVGCVLYLYRSSLIYNGNTAVFLSLYFIASVLLFLFAAWTTVKMDYRLQRTVLPDRRQKGVYLFRFLSVSGIVFCLCCLPFFIP